MAGADRLLPLLLKNSGYLAAATLGSALLNLLQGALGARMLGIEGYGTLVLVMTVVTSVNLLTSSRSSEFVVRYLTEALEQGRPADGGRAVTFSGLIEGGLAIVAFGLVAGLAPLLAQWFVKSGDGAALIALFNLSLLVRLLPETAIGVLQSLKRFGLLAIFNLAQSSLTLIILAAALLNGPSLRNALIAYVIAYAIHGVVLTAAAVRVLNQRLGPRWLGLPALGEWRSLASFLFNTNLGTTMSLLVKTSDSLWLGLFRGPAEVAYYRIAFSLATIVATPVAMLAQTFQTDINALVASRQLERLRRLLLRGSLMAAAWLVPVALICFGLSFVAVPLIYGADFTPAIPALGILLFGIVVMNIPFWSRSLLVAADYIGYTTAAAALVTLLKIIMVVTLVPKYGYLATAFILAVLYLLSAFLLCGKIVQIWPRLVAIRSEHQ